MQTDGQVTSIIWDFGDGSSGKTCEFRACAQTKKVFLTPGTYSVRVTVEYQGLPSATDTITLKVE
jgi:PKD repeat protein